MFHGASDGEPIRGSGPALPADATITMPASRAASAARVIAWFHGPLEPPPSEALITSTPSAAAWSIAATIQLSLQLPISALIGSSSQTLYMIRLACGATPD